MDRAHRRVPEPVDTLRWSAGEDRLCACEHCWCHEPFWRYVQVLASHAARASPGASNRDLAQGVWEALRAPRWRRLAWPASRRGLRRAVEALLDAAEREGWNPGQLYEAVLRGIALRWKGGGPSEVR